MAIFSGANLKKRGIAFFGNYLPRNCGIATFTHDLAEAVAKLAGTEQEIVVAAMNDRPEGYSYPERVKFELRQDYLIDYTRAADFLNFSNVNVVSVQHEYGIYGGDHGSNILAFLRNLSTPVIVTCHTVLENPDAVQKEVLREISEYSQKLVVMSDRAVDFLKNAYGIASDKIACIPHGIHNTPFVDPNYYKDKFGVEGRKVLLTFGLLHRNKGIEHVIEALPRIVSEFPMTTYVVLGATHPAVLMNEGESYRLGLQRRVRELGLEDNVIFYPRFVELNELLEYLGATDIFITPYLNLEQITSGALAYAMGTGKAVVSTPYWHAEELLADERGILVPPNDPDAISDAINSLLGDEIRLNAMRKRAYVYCQDMIWANIAQKYLEIFNEVSGKKATRKPIASSLRTPLEATNVPTPKMEHLLRLTDDTGPARHARYTLPDWRFGYSLDVTAATMVVACKYHRDYKTEESRKLMEKSLTLLETLIGEHGSDAVFNGLDYNRNPQGIAAEDDIGMAIWALGYIVRKAPAHLTVIANELFHQILPRSAISSPRGAAYAVLGGSNYLSSFPGAAGIRRFTKNQVSVLEYFLKTPNWQTLWGSGDWPMAVQAICSAAESLNDPELNTLTESLIIGIVDQTEQGTIFVRQGENPTMEELPITAATFIEALGANFVRTRDKNTLFVIRAAVDWFLGKNRIGAEVYDFLTGGCHDALTASGVNRNQGTEATAFCLLAFLSLNQFVSMVIPADHITPTAISMVD